MSTTTNSTAAAPRRASRASTPPDRLRAPPRKPKKAASGLPQVRIFHDGVNLVAEVALCGGQADGRSFFIKADDWVSVSAKCGPHWVPARARNGMEYVGSGKANAGRFAMQQGAAPRAILARLIVDAMPGERVSYRDGDRFNLRRENLEVSGRADDGVRRQLGFRDRTRTIASR